MSDFHANMRDLAEDIKVLSSVTKAIGWDKTGEDIVANPQDTGAKPIAPGEWQEAMKVALKLGVAVAGLPRPTPGADPEGFVWLTYEMGEHRRVAVQLRADRLVWTMKDALGDRTHEKRFVSSIIETRNAAIRDLAEALRVVFRAEAA
jgi:hypothetical protein